MKRLIFSLSFLLIALVTLAEDEQGFHFGLRAAPSLAWLRSDTKGYNTDGTKFGFSYGLITEFNFAHRYAFATGIDVTYRGGKFKTLESFNNGDSVVSTSSSYTLQYIEIPITLKLKTNEIGYLTYYLQAGVAPGVNIRARESYNATLQHKVNGAIETISSKDEGVDIQDNINNFNLSMIIAGGVEYTISGSTVMLVGIQFNNGFLDVFDGTPKVNSNYLALTLAVLF
jgi:hypothetical protein